MFRQELSKPVKAVCSASLRMLIEELDPAADSQVEQLWIAEAQRRYEAYLHGELSSLPGDEVMSRERSRLK